MTLPMYATLADMLRAATGGWADLAQRASASPLVDGPLLQATAEGTDRSAWTLQAVAEADAALARLQDVLDRASRHADTYLFPRYRQTMPLSESVVQASSQITGLRGHITLRTATVVHAAGQISGLRGHLTVRTIAVLGGAGRISGLRGIISVQYDNRVTRYLGQSVAASHHRAVPGEAQASMPWRVSAQKRDAAESGWHVARQSEAVVAVVMQPGAPRRQAVQARWQIGVQQHRQASMVHQTAVQHDTRRAAGWQLGDRRSVQSSVPLQTGVFRALHRAASWQTAKPLVRNLAALIGASAYHIGVQAAIHWQMATHARNGRSVLPVAPVQPIYPRDGDLLFEFERLAGSAHLVFGLGTYLRPSAHVVVPFLRVYVTVNSITLRRVDGDIPIPAYGVSMSLDADSWIWSWSASIPAAALALVQPGSNGDPVEVEAVVNGVPYRLCAEGIGSQREFAKGRISVQGRGTAAVLDAPYAPVLNFGGAEARTAQQLMLDVLTVNGVGMGWDVDFGLTDWLVPGNTWAHQGTYISAILAIAQAAGGYVQPHATAQTLRVLPRYPVAPWDWAGVTPDIELPSSAVAVEGIAWQRKADYNRVYVSGTANGVLAQVTRSGTAGDSVAPMITDSLITHADAARQRGLAVLSDTGQQARLSLKLPVLAETGLILPGKFVRYLDGTTPRIGLTRGLALDWSSPRLRQTISVETHL